MKARSLRNRLIALFMSLSLMGGQVLPVMATGDDAVVLASEDAVQTEEDENGSNTDSKEVIFMNPDRFYLGEEEEISVPLLGETEDDMIIYEIEGDEPGVEYISEVSANSAEEDSYDPRLGGLPVGNSLALANKVSTDVSYRTIARSIVDGAELDATASDEIAGEAEVEAAFPYASTEPDKICAYFDETYPIGRDQNPYGTCWAHSTLGATEFNLVHEGKADKTVNTSELALAYWTSYQGTAGPAGDNGNTVKRRYAKSEQENFLNSGGNTITAAMTLFQWRGVTNDSVVPYSDCEKVYTSEKIDTALEREDAYYITEYQEYDLENNPQLIKEAIKANGALSIAFCWAKDGYNSTTNAYYVDKEIGLNHFVTLVGWDDNFSKDNFKGAFYGYKPNKNGAWLVRNSWNQDGTKATMDSNQYFWISYEDKSIINVAGFKAVPKAQYGYDNNYFYDTQVYDPLAYKTGTAANVYKTSVCEAGEILSGVAFNAVSIAETGTKYTIEVYRIIPDGGDPSQGTKVDEATTTGTLYLSGSYTIPLKSEVRLDAEENFAVVVSRDDSISVSVAGDFNWKNWNLMSDMKALPGQSWLKDGGSWKDTNEAGNFVIHALTKNGGAYVKLSQRTATIPEDGELTLTAEAYDEHNNKVASPTFTWASDHPEIATVQNGKVKAVSVGKATITATYNNLKGKCIVNVGEEGTTAAVLTYGSTNVTGTDVALTANIRYLNTISYKGRKIKADKDLKAAITSSSLYDIAKSLSSNPGSVTNEIVTFSFTAKKNKNANSGSYFNVKAKAAKKSVAAAQGISGANYKKLKKAVSAFNKTAKKKDNSISFTITALNAAEMIDNGTMIDIITTNKYTGKFIKFSHFRARLDPETQPAFSAGLNYKTWTKISNKEFKIQKSGRTYIFTPQGKNVAGKQFGWTYKDYYY